MFYFLILYYVCCTVWYEHEMNLDWCKTHQEAGNICALLSLYLLHTKAATKHKSDVARVCKSVKPFGWTETLDSLQGFGWKTCLGAHYNC